MMSLDGHRTPPPHQETQTLPQPPAYPTNLDKLVAATEAAREIAKRADVFPRNLDDRAVSRILGYRDGMEDALRIMQGAR
jgi:hypothetical protein